MPSGENLYVWINYPFLEEDAQSRVSLSKPPVGPLLGRKLYQQGLNSINLSLGGWQLLLLVKMKNS